MMQRHFYISKEFYKICDSFGFRLVRNKFDIYELITKYY